MRQEVSTVSGYVDPDFEAVREAFAENFQRRNELGAACCVYYHGEKVVDLWGGVRDKATREPWEEDTMALVASATKGLAGLTMALAHSRGLFDYDDRVAKYWPEFAQQGKDKITIRQLLAHQAGLFALDKRVDIKIEADLDRLAVLLARQRPAWEPGTRQAYHAITLGFYESELLRRVDTKHRSLRTILPSRNSSSIGPRILHRPAGRYSQFQVDEKLYGQSSTRSIQSTHPANACGGISPLTYSQSAVGRVA